MSASLPARRAVVAIIALLLTAAARQASATETAGPELQAELVWTAPARWYVELIGASCPSQRQDFEHEIALAAAPWAARAGACPRQARPSSGRSSIARVPQSRGRSRRAPSKARSSTGSVWRARPPIVFVRPPSRWPATPRRSARLPSRPSAPRSRTKDPTGLEKRSEKFVLVLGGRATTTAARTVPSTGGAHLLGGLALGKTVRGTLGLAGEAGGSADKAIRTFRGGLGIGVGAPFDSGSVVGIAGEMGLATTTKYGSSTANSDGGGLLTTRTDLVGYGQTTFTLQWPRAGLRPYAALSAAVMSEGAARVSASGEAGLAFALF